MKTTGLSASLQYAKRLGRAAPTSFDVTIPTTLPQASTMGPPLLPGWAAVGIRLDRTELRSIILAMAADGAVTNAMVWHTLGLSRNEAVWLLGGLTADGLLELRESRSVGHTTYWPNVWADRGSDPGKSHLQIPEAVVYFVWRAPAGFRFGSLSHDVGNGGRVIPGAREVLRGRDGGGGQPTAPVNNAM